MIKHQLIYILFCIFSTFFQSLNAQKIELNAYENKAKAFAILAAQYNTDAYNYSRKNYFLSSKKEILSNCDSGLVSIEIAQKFTDSSLFYAGDTCYHAKKLLQIVRAYQTESKNAFLNVANGSNFQSFNRFSEIAMYNMGNAISDAYMASLLIKTKTITSQLKDDKRSFTRLESDENSYVTIKQLYTNRLIEIRDEIKLLEVESKNSSGKDLLEINNAINLLNEEEKQYVNKVNNSEYKLINVKNELSAEMMQIVNGDVFVTDKKGFYNENVPIPTNVEIPMGLVYRIQIGFFANQLTPEHFDGIFPISSQKIDNVYYRYEAGNFPTYEEAQQSKKIIINKGYSDSFLIAYYNRKKISISEALQKQQQSN
ncbi:hypothetical protein FRY74_07625 [Vicingus serpentipes]|uniref:SPOR domain-containing protein n=1 Tax=Vicingus serpentipes TaxID=1926625 RepID=A0A5C6RSP9_9FLAO|nr:SPOR domain-containing protein [Vicingus serpentipes]TXB65283.1 hypothetical protein FRY74_07625 [Vicingus serpentipes]